MQRKIYYFLFVISYLLFYQSGVSQVNKLSISEKVISTFSNSALHDNTFFISNDKNHIAYRLVSGKKQFAVIDGKKGKAYDSVANIVFSPDGKRIAYVAKYAGKWKVIVNGQEQNIGLPKSVCRNVLFSPDSKKLLLIVKSGSKVILMVNGIAGKAFDEINENSITFSKDCRSMAFSVQKGNMQAIIFNGKESAWHQQVGFPVLSSSGKRIGYWATDSGSNYAVIDNKKEDSYDQVYTIAFSNGDKHVAYFAKKENKYYVVEDGVKSEEYEHVHSLMFSPDGERLAYAVETHERNEEEFNHAVVIDGKKMKTYETVVEGSFLFSSDSKHFAYEVEWHDEFFVINDGVEGKRYQDVMQITMTYSPNNNRIAYAFENDSKRQVCVDGEVGESYEDIYAIAFSSDSKLFAYSARDSMWDFIVINNYKSQTYDHILGQGSIVFDNAKTIHFLAMKGNNIILVKASVTE